MNVTTRSISFGALIALAAMIQATNVSAQQCTDVESCPPCYYDSPPWTNSQGGSREGLRIINISLSGVFSGTTEEAADVAAAGKAAANAWNAAANLCGQSIPYLANWVDNLTCSIGTPCTHIPDIVVVMVGDAALGGSCADAPLHQQIRVTKTLVDSGVANLTVVLEHELGHQLGLANVHNPDGSPAQGCVALPGDVMAVRTDVGCKAVGGTLEGQDVAQVIAAATDPNHCTLSVYRGAIPGVPCECTDSSGNQFLGSTGMDGSCDCATQCFGGACDPDAIESNCGGGTYCDDSLCCQPCQQILPCEPAINNDSCWCSLNEEYADSDYCYCLTHETGLMDCSEITPEWFNDYPATCFEDGPGCPNGVIECKSNAGQCQGSGAACDSNGCCTVTCIAPSNGVCPVGWVIEFYNEDGTPKSQDNCCVRESGGCGSKACYADADCDGLFCSPTGCCGCSPDEHTPCGICGWETIQCDGTCRDDGCACNYGWPCNNCGTYECDGTTCDDPCPNPPGGSCGGCGSYDDSGSNCNDPCNGCSGDQGDSCGNCGSIQCDGSCDDPCTCAENEGEQCGSCGSVQCDGSCNDPCDGCDSNYNQGCGNCGTTNCDGSCDDPCSCGGGNGGPGSGCGNCGTVQGDCSCDDPCS